MRYSAAEKNKIIQLAQNSNLAIRRSLARQDIHKSTFYYWLKSYQDNGVDGLGDKKLRPQVLWNKITVARRDSIIDLALDKPALSPGEIAVCHTDEKAYFVWESTVYRLLKQQDLITSSADILVQDSDNCPCYISGEFAAYLGNKGMTHARSRAYHPQTHDKIERWHRSMKNQILLSNYYLLGELQEQLHQFVSYSNHERYHDSLSNLTLANDF